MPANIGAEESRGGALGASEPGHRTEGAEGQEEVRAFSVRWMLERERAREASDDCSSAFAIIPVGQ